MGAALSGATCSRLLAIAFYVVGKHALQALMESSRCGAECMESTFFLVLKPLVFTVLCAFIVVGAVDVMMQRWLFGRDMKMTRSETKRERKDIDGDPQINRLRSVLMPLLDIMQTMPSFVYLIPVLMLFGLGQLRPQTRETT